MQIFLFIIFLFAYVKDNYYLCTLKYFFTIMTHIILVTILVLAGVLLLVAEMFLIPGFGIAGISGFGCLLAAVVWSYLKISITAGYVTLGACVALSGLAIWGFFHFRAIDKMALDTKIDGQVSLANNKLQKEEESSPKAE